MLSEFSTKVLTNALQFCQCHYCFHRFSHGFDKVSQFSRSFLKDFETSITIERTYLTLHQRLCRFSQVMKGISRLCRYCLQRPVFLIKFIVKASRFLQGSECVSSSSFSRFKRGCDFTFSSTLSPISISSEWANLSKESPPSLSLQSLCHLAGLLAVVKRLDIRLCHCLVFNPF